MHGPKLPVARPARRHGATAAGSTSPTPAASSTVDGRRIAFAGVDDSAPRARPLRRRSPARPTRTADVRIGLTHSPEPRVLDRFAADGYDLLLCRPHPRRPAAGARSTARWSPTAASTAHRVALAAPLGRPRPVAAHLAGLGTSPYAPVRFACPPEATLLTLAAREPPEAPRRSAV